MSDPCIHEADFGRISAILEGFEKTTDKLSKGVD